MYGALYYPYIGVPKSAWWTRTLLYWESVATITPEDYIYQPELHDPHTLELIQNELVLQVTPGEAGRQFATSFERFISVQDENELARRRASFRMGNHTRIHLDKMMIYELGLSLLVDHGLARLEGPRWASVEEATAAEFMAALALSLCQSVGPQGWGSGSTPQNERWVPVTDDLTSAQALLSGLSPVRNETAGDRVDLRALDELDLAEVRSVVLESVLPVPDSPMDVADLVRFRRRHGDLLPRFRHDMEARVQAMADLKDPIQFERALGNLEYEVEERCRQLAAYLEEAGVRRVVRSRLVSLLKLVPGLKDSVDTVQDLLAGQQRDDSILYEPLAYLAFATSEMFLAPKYEIDPLRGTPLLTAMSRR